MLELLKYEVNVLDAIVVQGDGLGVEFDTNLTPELKMLGLARELIREIQISRKEKGCRIDEHVVLHLPEVYKTLSKELLAHVQKETVADSIVWAEQFSVSTTENNNI